MLPVRHAKLNRNYTYSVYNISSSLSGASLLDTYEKALSHAEIREIEKFANTAERIRRLMGKSLLRMELAAVLTVRPCSLDIQRSPRGKPFIANISTRGLCFNLSHSGNFIAIATGPTEVGVDIEECRPLEQLDEIGKSCFSAQEYQLFQNVDAHRRQKAFFRFWTRREALLKAVGTGLVRPPDCISAGGNQTIDEIYKVRSFKSPRGYEAAIAWRL